MKYFKTPKKVNLRIIISLKDLLLLYKKKTDANFQALSDILWVILNTDTKPYFSTVCLVFLDQLGTKGRLKPCLLNDS